MADNNNTNSSRGFAAMDDDKQREIASKGGKASHQNQNTQNEGSESGGNER